MDGGSRGGLDRAMPTSQSGYSNPRSAFPAQSAFSPLDEPLHEHQPMYGRSPAGMQGGRSLQDIEDEMRMLSQRQRFEEASNYNQSAARMQAGRSAADIVEERRRRAQRQYLLAQRAQQPSPQAQQRLYQLQQQQQQQMYGSPQMGGMRQHARMPSDLHLQQPQQHLPHQPARAAPPRMHPHSASPRFHQMQQEIQIDQHQQQQKLELLNKQLQREQQERLLGRVPDDGFDPRGADLRVAEELAQLRRHSPAFDPHLQQAAGPFLPDNIQMEQLLLRRQANEKFMRDMVGHEQVGQRILEAERMEERRRIKAMKLSHMARYNDLMTQSDKDFITRIQVSQLVTQDPYAEDFYAQIYTAVMRSKLGLPEVDARVINFASGGGVGVGVANRPNGRRAGAMAKMESQVEKIVQAARQREKEKGTNGQLHHRLSVEKELTCHLQLFTACKERWARLRVAATRPHLDNCSRSATVKRRAPPKRLLGLACKPFTEQVM
jgi:DNA topoisomerase 2-associated protein PAT1